MSRTARENGKSRVSEVSMMWKVKLERGRERGRKVMLDERSECQLMTRREQSKMNNNDTHLLLRFTVAS